MFFQLISVSKIDPWNVLASQIFDADLTMFL